MRDISYLSFVSARQCGSLHKVGGEWGRAAERTLFSASPSLAGWTCILFPRALEHSRCARPLFRRRAHKPHFLRDRRAFSESHPFTSSNFHVIFSSTSRHKQNYALKTLICFKHIEELHVLLKTNFFFLCIMNFVGHFVYPILSLLAPIFLLSIKVLLFLVSLCNGLLNLFLTSGISVGMRYVGCYNLEKLNVNKIFTILF